jgi:hypothetical protein
MVAIRSVASPSFYMSSGWCGVGLRGGCRIVHDQGAVEIVDRGAG